MGDAVDMSKRFCDAGSRTASSGDLFYAFTLCVDERDGVNEEMVHTELFLWVFGNEVMRDSNKWYVGRQLGICPGHFSFEEGDLKTVYGLGVVDIVGGDGTVRNLTVGDVSFQGLGGWPTGVGLKLPSLIRSFNFTTSEESFVFRHSGEESDMVVV